MSVFFGLKVGDPKDVVRKMIRNLFKLLTKIYPASKLFNYVMEGITSKNSKTRMGRFTMLALIQNSENGELMKPCLQSVISFGSMTLSKAVTE